VDMLTLNGGLCCVGSINPTGVAAGVQRLSVSVEPTSVGYT
jgi:hypothetical protein